LTRTFHLLFWKQLVWVRRGRFSTSLKPLTISQAHGWHWQCSQSGETRRSADDKWTRRRMPWRHTLSFYVLRSPHSCFCFKTQGVDRWNSWSGLVK
jgi:hypothetical protein